MLLGVEVEVALGDEAPDSHLCQLEILWVPVTFLTQVLSIVRSPFDLK